MKILESIKDECFEATITNNEEYDKLCEKRDQIEFELVAASNKQVRELLRKFIDVMDEFVYFYTDYALGFCYDKLKEVIREIYSMENKSI